MVDAGWSESRVLYEKLLRGEATSREYVAALRRDAARRVDALRKSARLAPRTYRVIR